MTAPPIFEMSGGTVVLGGATVLRDIDLAIGADEFVALLGENGSGKTTLVRALLGLVPLHRGGVRLFGRDLKAFRDWARIGYVPQRFTAAAGVPATVEEVVLSGRAGRVRPPKRYEAADRAAVARALDAVGLTDLTRRRVSTLSGGQQQRVLIARALANDPQVLVLDEPVSSVDIENQQSFAATLAGLRREGAAVLLVAHSLGAMQSLVGRTVVLTGGRISYDGPPRPSDVDEHHVHHQPAAEHGTGAYRRVAGGAQ